MGGISEHYRQLLVSEIQNVLSENERLFKRLQAETDLRKLAEDRIKVLEDELKQVKHDKEEYKTY